MKGDREGEMTFTGGRGETMIDYVIGNRPACENIERLEVGDEIESDHQSVTVWMGEVEEQGRKRDKEEEWVDWSEEAREEFRRKRVEEERKENRIRGGGTVRGNQRENISKEEEERNGEERRMMERRMQAKEKGGKDDVEEMERKERK